MPTGKTLWNWARAHEDFRLMKAHALETARAASLAAQGARDAGKRAGWDRPGRRTAWNAGFDGYGQSVADPILAQLMGGETLAVICAAPGMPSVGTVYNWLRRYPEFLERYRRAKIWAPEIMVQDACEHLQWEGARKSYVTLGRTIRAAERVVRRRSLKRLAPRAGPEALMVVVEDADGTRRVVYGEEQPQRQA